jgi:hypothetical protein
MYPDYPEDFEGDKTTNTIVDIVKKLKELGNDALLKERNFEAAGDIYDKVHTTHIKV